MKRNVHEPSSMRRIAAGVLAGIVGSAVVGRIAVQRRLDRRVAKADGLDGPVTIGRNRLGIPRIVASSRNDALFGLGYAVASDRLWQMDLIRRKAYGRLAEIAGPSELHSDRMMRYAGIAVSAAKSVDHCSPDALSALESFAAGVNHFMTNHPVPKEFVLAGYRPEPWRPADSIAVMLLMGWSLGGHMYRVDLFAERCRRVIGDEWTDAMFHGRMTEAPPSIREQYNGPLIRQGDEASTIFPMSGFSNSWAVSGKRSWTGKPLLAFDPHLEYSNPSIWYEAMLDAPDFHVAGMTLPGLPGIGAGRNLHIAWGETAGMIVQSFLYREELDETGTRVRDGDKWVDLVIDRHTILVKGGEQETLDIRRTPRGPLISDLETTLTDEPVSLHWTGMEPTTEPDLLLALNTAKSVHDTAYARRFSGVPCYNASVADSEGNIAQVVVGKIPVRKPRAGLLDVSEFPPQYIPVDERPMEINPSRGWVAGANTRLVGEDYLYPMFGFWEPPHRMRRISSVLESRKRHSLADMKDLQLDRYSLHASELVPVMLDVLRDYPQKWVLDDLAGWNFIAETHSRPTAIFETFYTRWMRVSLQHQFHDETILDDLLSAGAGAVPRDFCDKLLTGDYPAWFGNDDRVRRELARVAMDAALVWLEEQLGPDRESWTWGSLNTITFRHPLGMIGGPQQRRVNPGPYPVGGDRTTVWPTAWKSSDDFTVVGGPSMRLVMDMRRPELSWGVNTLGQQGTPWKRNYRDQVADFFEGRFHRIWQVEEPASSVVINPTDR
jgi:penicillin amidase